MSMTPERKQIQVTVARLPEEAINELDERMGELWREENIDHDNDELISDDMMGNFNMLVIGYDAAWSEVERLSVALEESQQRIGKLELYVKSLEFNREDTQKHANEKLRERDTNLVEAQQTIARQLKALEKIAHPKLMIGSTGLNSMFIARTALGNKEGNVTRKDLPPMRDRWIPNRKEALPMSKVYFPNHLVVEMLGLSLDCEIVDVDLEGSEVVFTLAEEGSDKA